MKVKIPSLNSEEKYIENKKSIVLVGANGSGKTRMSIWIDNNNDNINLNVHRVSAQKSLSLPISTKPSEIDTAQEKFFYGTTNDDKTWLMHNGKKSYRWGNKPETHLLNDFSILMEYLITENYEKSIEYRKKHKNGDITFNNETKLEKIKTIWENIITHRKLEICTSKIEVFDIDANTQNQVYNGSEMSDGERAIFYFIAEVICAKENSLIIIDEPENHLHKSILVRLWDAIELSRPDCMFLYITHDLDFASSRINSQIIWVKNLINNNTWDYEIIDDIHSSDRLLLEILGNRQKVMLVEGTPTKSIDKKLYSKLFPEYNIIPLESCTNVIQTTKAYNEITDIHYTEVKGIIDRDRRNDQEIAILNNSNIFVPDVAEIENLFLLPDVIQIVANKQNKTNIQEILSTVQSNIINFLKNHIDEQALLFTKQKYQNNIFQQVNKKVNTLEQYKSNISQIYSVENIDSIFNQIKNELQLIVDNSDVYMALKVINNKALLPDSKVSNFFGWKKDYYINYVLSILDDNIVGEELKNIFKNYIRI